MKPSKLAAKERRLAKKRAKLLRKRGLQPPPEPADFLERARSLRILGLASYPDYLASDLWRSIRSRVLRRDGHRCRTCPKKATQVHHQSYGMSAMDGTDISSLYSLCRDCHEAIELCPDGSKRNPAGVADRLDRLLRPLPMPRRRKWKRRAEPTLNDLDREFLAIFGLPR